MCSVVWFGRHVKFEEVLGRSVMPGFVHGDILAFHESESNSPNYWFVYAFYREGDTQASMSAFNNAIGRMYPSGMLKHANIGTPIKIPVEVTSLFVDAKSAYEGAVESLYEKGCKVEMQLRPDDRWFKRTFCADLTPNDAEIVARWESVTVRFAKDVSPVIVDFHFCNGCSYTETSFYRARYDILENDHEMRNLLSMTHAEIPPDDEQLDAIDHLNLKTLISEYLLMCKTTHTAVLVFRCPRHRRVISLANQLMWGMWEFRRLGALLDGWRGFRLTSYINSTRKNKYEYYYVQVFGPIGSYNKKRLLENAKAICPYTNIARVAQMEVYHVYEFDDKKRREQRNYSPLSRLGVRRAFGGLLGIVRPSYEGLWRGLHKKLLDMTIIFEALHLSDYVLLWLFEHVGVKHAPELQRQRLICSVINSIRRVRAQRDVRRNPKRQVRNNTANRQEQQQDVVATMPSIYEFGTF